MFFLFALIVIAILTIKVRIQFHNINIDISEAKISKINNLKEILNSKNKYNVKIIIKIFNIIPIYKKNILNYKKKNNKKSEKINNNFKSIKKKYISKFIKKLIISNDIEIKNFYLNVKIGLNNIMILVYLIPFLSTIISSIFANREEDIKNKLYKIKPVYNEREFYKNLF